MKIICLRKNGATGFAQLRDGTATRLSGDGFDFAATDETVENYEILAPIEPHAVTGIGLNYRRVSRGMWRSRASRSWPEENRARGHRFRALPAFRCALRRRRLVSCKVFSAMRFMTGLARTVAQIGAGRHLMIKRDALKPCFYGPEMPEVLFDLARDPGETEDFSREPEYAEAGARFRRRDELGFAPQQIPAPGKKHEKHAPQLDRPAASF